MLRQEREELERQVLRLERSHPDWSAAQMESELESLVPVAFGSWKAETPLRRSRLRAVQRWRRGSRGRDAGRGVQHLFPYLWPVGEQQRREVDPNFAPSTVVSAGSWRVFLYNCGPEVVRDVRVTLDDRPLDYSPSILTGRFSEVHWQRLESLRTGSGLGESGASSQHRLRVEFVIARGTRQAELVGELTLDPLQGWVHFTGRDGRARELE